MLTSGSDNKVEDGGRLKASPDGCSFSPSQKEKYSQLCVHLTQEELVSWAAFFELKAEEEEKP